MMVARVWSKHRLHPHRLERYMSSNDPDFEQKAADIIGPYLNPPAHAAGVPVWNVLILLNFFRRLPVELEKSAAMDGAGHWKILWRIYIPTSLAALATLVLFVAVTHWNAWFDGMIYMRSLEKYPLQTFLRFIVAVKDMTFLRSMTLQEGSTPTTASAACSSPGSPMWRVTRSCTRTRSASSNAGPECRGVIGEASSGVRLRGNPVDT